MRAACVAQHPGDPVDDRLALRPALGVGRNRRIVGQLRLADRLPEPLPDRVVAQAERHRLVRCLEHLVDRDHAVPAARAPGQLARAEVRHEPAAP